MDLGEVGVCRCRRWCFYSKDGAVQRHIVGSHRGQMQGRVSDTMGWETSESGSVLRWCQFWCWLRLVLVGVR
jgi:hypothetical protein